MSVTSRWPIPLFELKKLSVKQDISQIAELYIFYSGNTKLYMPFGFNFDIRIPMLARYSGRRRIDMDPMQFCNVRDILNYGEQNSIGSTSI